MRAALPKPAFASAPLTLATIEAGQIFGRIYFGRHPDPLGYVKTPSRFSDPRRRIPEHRFGVLYLGASVKVCFLEAVLRDKRNGAIRDHPMGEVELRARRYAEIEVVEPLRLVDLRGDGPVRMGIPSGVPRCSRHSLSRA
jgi:RES domain